MRLTEAEVYQLKLLKSKTPQERFCMMAGLIESQFRIMSAGLQYANPSADKKEIARCLKERMMKIYSLKH
jgi:hypothetical protein